MAKLFENLWVKVAALMLAGLLWFHVATDKIFQNELALPVTQIDIPEDFVLSEPPPDSIVVLVSARGKTLLRSDWKKSGLKLAISKVHQGRFKAELSTANAMLVKSDKVDLIDIVGPREIFLVADRKQTKEVPIISRLSVFPEEGYAISHSDSIVPQAVDVVGPRTQVAAIDHIETEKLVLENVRNNFERKLGLVLPPVYGLTLTPDSVMVYIRVEPIKRKEFHHLAIQLINAPESTLYDISPATIDLRVAGEMNYIDSLQADMISVIADFILRSHGGTIPVQVILPPSISLLHQSVDSVRIIRKNDHSWN
jgi:YbbR domain-containing protein